MSSQFTFSGHESFPCRHLWLKKGYDFVSNGRKFAQDDSIVHLGVGKNMVTSIQFWMRSFGLLDEEAKPTRIADYLFGSNGQDPYIEDMGTLWLLHYLLVVTGKASIYQLMFNEFRKQHLEFTRDQVSNYLNRKCAEVDYMLSPRTLRSDIDVFVRNYARPVGRSTNIEDDYSVLLTDLELVQGVSRSRQEGGAAYRIESRDRTSLPSEIVLYALLQQNEGQSISFSRLLTEPDNVGSVFALSRDGLQRHADVLASVFPEITFTDDAGIKEIQFSKRPDPFAVLDRYYHNAHVFTFS